MHEYLYPYLNPPLKNSILSLQDYYPPLPSPPTPLLLPQQVQNITASIHRVVALVEHVPRETKQLLQDRLVETSSREVLEPVWEEF